MKRLLEIISLFVNRIPARMALVWLFAGWLLYYVSLAVWSENAFATYMTTLEKSRAFQAVFLAFALVFALDGVKSFIRRKREKGAFYAAMRAVMPAGIFVFLLGFLMSAAFRHQIMVLTSVRDAVKPPWSDKQYEVVGIDPALKGESLDVDEGAGIFRREPKMTLSDGKLNYEIGAYPPKRFDGSYFHILDFGIAPGVRIQEQGSPAEEGYIALKILPPGAVDSFEFPPLPYRFELSLAPERIMTKGGGRIRVFNLNVPSYHVRVLRGADVIAEGDSDAEISFDGYGLAFYDPLYWVVLVVVKDPGVPFLVLGICLVSIGLPLSLSCGLYSFIASLKKGPKES